MGKNTFLNDIYTIWLREMLNFWHAKSRIVGGLGMPFFWLAIMGVGFSQIIPTVEGISYMEFLLPGILGMTLLFSSIHSGISVLADKQFGFMKEIMVAPISRLSIMLGKTLGGSTSAMIYTLMLLLLAVVIGININGIIGFSLALVFMVLISVNFVAFGISLASRMTDMSGFQLIMNFLIMPMFFLSGAFFPINQTPLWMQTIAYLNPFFYGVDGLRGSLMGVSALPIWLDFIILASISTVMVLIGTYLFKKTEA